MIGGERNCGEWGGFDGIKFYFEFLILKEDGSWTYQNGNKLEENKKVTAWMDGPSTFFN